MVIFTNHNIFYQPIQPQKKGNVPNHSIMVVADSPFFHGEIPRAKRRCRERRVFDVGQFRTPSINFRNIKHHKTKENKWFIVSLLCLQLNIITIRDGYQMILIYIYIVEPPRYLSWFMILITVINRGYNTTYNQVAAQCQTS